MEEEATAVPATTTTMTTKRTTLEGCWILDKARGTPSMRGYLETMGVTDLAIQAHEKGEAENDTFHTIELDSKKVKITKRSRVNNDLVVSLELGQESLEQLPPGDRVKRSLATSENLTTLEIQSSLNTMNGMARIVDKKYLLIEEDDKVVMVQELTVANEQTGKSHTTVRYFNPYTDTPPHLVEDADEVMQEEPHL